MTVSVVSTSTWFETGSNSGTRTPGLPPNIVSGNLLIAFIAMDGNTEITCTTSGWKKLVQESYSSTVCAALFYKLSDGSDGFSFTTATTEMGSCIIYNISGAQMPEFSSSNGTGSNAAPASLDPLADGVPVACLVFGGWDSTPSVTEAPIDFLDLIVVATTSTAGARAASAHRLFTAGPISPGPFTSTSEQWVTFTVIISEGYILEGLVQDLNGQPAAGRTVNSFFSGTGQLDQSTTTGADGSFVLYYPGNSGQRDLQFVGILGDGCDIFLSKRTPVAQD